ncbi:MAG: DMT family transporter [Rickettsiales bacterium]|nr:DMT family transporter [Rickettsiales bacterium]
MHKNSNLFILILLGIIWSSFAAFTKVSAENLLPFFVTFSRLVLGGALLYGLALIKRKKVFVVKNFKHYAIVGFFNSALPFTLFAISSREVDSSIAAILDGCVPMFEVLISIFVLKRFVDKSAIWGIVFGIVGVVVTYFGGGFALEITWSYSLAVLAILVATASYAGASLYLNAKCKHIESITMATGSVLFAALLLSPSVFFTDFSVIDKKVAGSLLGLGLLCTGVAYVLFFKLIAEEGPRTAVSVVLLIPVFGTIFGAMFLGEVVTASKVVGCLMILVSMKFILNLSKQNFFKSKNAPAV